MNRTLTSGGITLAMIGIFSCTEHSLTGVDNFASDDLSADASRIATVSVSLGSESLAVGDTTQAIVTLKDYRGQIITRDVNWRSSDSGIASVDSAGLVRGVAPGTAVITAWRGFKSGSATITVTPAVTPGEATVASVSVSLAVSSLNPGQFTQATATAYDSSNNVLTGRAVAWTSSDTSIATISSAGVVTAVAVGTAQIVATSEGKTGAAPLSVTSPPQQTTNPGTVTDLKVIAADSTGITVSFTQVNDGTGHPASYDARYAAPPIAWGSATSTTAGTCTVPIAGTAIGSPLVCKVLGLTASTKYDLQLIAFRGTLNFDAVFGSLSNVVSATTTASAPPPPPPPPASVASVSVSPASASLTVGSTVQLSAVTRDSLGNVLTGRVISWSSANPAVASVNPTSGLVTAIGAGAAQITAMSEARTGTAAITVTASDGGGGGGQGWRANEPAGMTLIDERPFNSLAEHASPHVPAWDTDPTLSIVSDGSAPQSPSNVLRSTFPTGFPGGTSSGHTGVPFGGRRVLYITYAAKYSSNWWGHLTGVNKQIYVWANGKNIVFFEASGVGTAPLQPRIVTQATPNDQTYTPNLVPSAVIPRGQWFNLEIVLTGNSSGAADGSVDWWVNGVHVGSRTNVAFTSGATLWDTFEIRPVWGGLNDIVPATQTLDWDDVYLSAKN